MKDSVAIITYHRGQIGSGRAFISYIRFCEVL